MRAQAHRRQISVLRHVPLERGVHLRIDLGPLTSEIICDDKVSGRHPPCRRTRFAVPFEPVVSVVSEKGQLVVLLSGGFAWLPCLDVLMK